MSGGISITTKTEVIREAHELQISSTNRPPPSKPRQPITFRAEDVSTDSKAIAPCDGVSLNSDYGGSGQDDK